ncbi:phasin family protein [Photobacterium sp. TY1-4]|uniref:phasin family protein n=1 Tax=Photobacterium sp. TY1-4 TaxID=2899122 RepID=UPI0021BF8FAE|nr:phasin family protein [Photobacterium sp. TY1-4]UXI02672.1 phasin family protein [Photobacterium sp. TY1-4]
MGIFKQTAEESRKEQIRDAMVYNIWLAGLGAYAKSTEEVNQLSDKGKSLFDELIERGRMVESKTKERVHTARTQTSVAIEERVHTMVQKLIGIDNDRLDRVDDKIDQLTANIEALLARQEANVGKAAAKPAEKVAEEKTATEKTVATRARKPGVARRKPVKAAASTAGKATATTASAEKPSVEKPSTAKPSAAAGETTATKADDKKSAADS